jgi:hypothetical protein
MGSLIATKSMLREVAAAAVDAFTPPAVKAAAT